jgi:hypothetical protein
LLLRSTTTQPKTLSTTAASPSYLPATAKVNAFVSAALEATHPLAAL